MVTIPQEHLMNTYIVPEENSSTVAVLNDSNSNATTSKPLKASDPKPVHHEIPTQPSSQELSTQESTQNDTQEDVTIADQNNNSSLQRQSISSQSSIASVSSTTISSSHINEPDEPSYITDLIKRAKTYSNDESLESEQSKLLVKELATSLNKARAEAGQYKIKAELLSISSKDADMRYEVENDLIKRQVERLKVQSENMDVLMKKINHQKLTLKKYKNEIINKNKEIIRLRSKHHNDLNNSAIKKRKKSINQQNTSNNEVPGMLDTLGFLASQVLTEEQKQNNSHLLQNGNTHVMKSNSSHELYQNHNNTPQHPHHLQHPQHPQHAHHPPHPQPQQFAMPKLNSFKHRSTSDKDDHGHNETTISEYSINQ